MQIITAEHAGFCFGVKRAVSEVYALTEKAQPHAESAILSGGNAGCKTKIYTIGKLIHNPQITGELEKKGVSVISPEEISEISDKTNSENKSIIVIRAHGIRKEISERLSFLSESNLSLSVCDMTCPYVKKIHRLVQQHADRKLLILGDPKHPETDGICSYSSGDAVVFGNSEELCNISKSSPELMSMPVIAVSQTTQSTEEWKKCQEIIKKLYTNAIVFDTICSVTEERQKEADILSRQADIMLVVGGRESSNTAKLYKTAKANLDDTYFIENPDDIIQYSSHIAEKAKKNPDLKVVITAGASTPGAIIQEVIKLMSQIENTNVAAENFAEMLEDSLKTLNTGETVVGTITSISANELHVDLGTKVTGIIPYDEITDESQVNLSDMFKVGDEIKATVIKVSDRDGVATLSKKRADSVLNWSAITDAFNDGAIIEGKVTEAVKGGVIMKYKGIRVFVPASQSGVPKSGDINSIVGKTKKAKIIDINESRHRAVASIRAVESEERKQREADFWANIEIGKQYEGEVKSLTSYGAFVDLGGVDGMVHSSELSWRHIKNPAEVVSLGQTIKVYVKDFDPETKRISLGYKTEDTNPWNIFMSKYHIGDVADVKIVSLMPFGAFAEIIPGADGLIHISQITDHKISKPADVLELNQVVKAKIIDIDEENHKISLSIRALMEEEKENEEAENVAEAGETVISE